MLNTLDDAVTPAANWILEILSAKDNLIQVTKETITADRLHQFQHTIGKPFIANLKENISSGFAFKDIVGGGVERQRDQTETKTKGKRKIDEKIEENTQEKDIEHYMCVMRACCMCNYSAKRAELTL